MATPVRTYKGAKGSILVPVLCPILTKSMNIPPFCFYNPAPSLKVSCIYEVPAQAEVTWELHSRFSILPLLNGTCRAWRPLPVSYSGLRDTNRERPPISEARPLGNKTHTYSPLGLFFRSKFSSVVLSLQDHFITMR